MTDVQCLHLSSLLKRSESETFGDDKPTTLVDDDGIDVASLDYVEVRKLLLS